MKKFYLLPSLVLIAALCRSCSGGDEFSSGRSDIPETSNTETDWKTTVLVVEYDDDEITPVKTTETYFDEYGRKTGTKTTGRRGAVLNEEIKYVYKGSRAQFYYVFHNEHDIAETGADRFRHVVEFTDDWRDIVSETTWLKNKENSRSEYDRDGSGRVCGFRYYYEGKLYSGSVDYSYNGDNETRYDVFYDRSGNIRSRQKVEITVLPREDGYTRREITYTTDGESVAYGNEADYDMEGRLHGLRVYSGEELYAEEKDFEYSGKEAVYYRYHYMPDLPEEQRGDISPTRSGPEPLRYKTRIRKLFY